MDEEEKSLWKFLMKHRLQNLALCAVLVGGSFFMAGPKASAEAPMLAHEAKSAVLMDATTGTVLFKKNEHAKLPIASVTKVATMLLAMEAIERGQVRMSDPIRTSDYAASMGGSQIFLQPGEVMTLRDMLKGIAIASANDAAVAVAEHIAGSEANFVQMMNKKAQELGLHDTHFVNVNGLPIPNHYSSAYDLAVLSRELVKHSEITKFTGVYSDYLRNNTTRPFWLVNTNKLVRFYQGMDGIKTGFTAEAKYCLAASAKRNHFRVISVVLGEPTSKTRNGEVTEMMNYAFSHFDTKIVYDKGQVVTLVPVVRGQLQAVAVKAKFPVGILISKMDQSSIGQTVTEVKPLIAPVKKGQVAGFVKVFHNGTLLTSVPVVTAVDVAKVSLWEMLGRSLRSMFLFGVKQ